MYASPVFPLKLAYGKAWQTGFWCRFKFVSGRLGWRGACSFLAVGAALLAASVVIGEPMAVLAQEEAARKQKQGTQAQPCGQAPQAQPCGQGTAVVTKAKEGTEFTPVPLVGGSSDVGIGGGAMVSYAVTRPGFSPYVFRLELFSMTTMKGRDDGLYVSYQDHYFMAHWPHVIKDQFSFKVRASFTRESALRYYGLGNVSHLPPSANLTDQRFKYDRLHPELRLYGLVHLTKRLVLDLRVNYTLNWLDFGGDTRLAQDLADPELSLTDPGHFHQVVYLGAGVQWDARDTPVATSRGHLQTLRVDWAPGGTRALAMPYRFARFNVASHFYVPVFGPASVLAFRLLGDFLLGDAPVYELARFNDTSAFGGPEGVRGIPGQRYHGKLKVFGNLEWRQVLFGFPFLGKQNKLAAVVFADAGRLWSGVSKWAKRLDGKTLRVHYGLGGGLRLLAGCSFVIRADVAWSRDARPVGAYFGAGQVF